MKQLTKDDALFLEFCQILFDYGIKNINERIVFLWNEKELNFLVDEIINLEEFIGSKEDLIETMTRKNIIGNDDSKYIEKLSTFQNCSIQITPIPSQYVLYVLNKEKTERTIYKLKITDDKMILNDGINKYEFNLENDEYISKCKELLGVNE